MGDVRRSDGRRARGDVTWVHERLRGGFAGVVGYVGAFETEAGEGEQGARLLGHSISMHAHMLLHALFLVVDRHRWS
jgi:hypothetical protein